MGVQVGLKNAHFSQKKTQKTPSQIFRSLRSRLVQVGLKNAHFSQKNTFSNFSLAPLATGPSRTEKRAFFPKKHKKTPFQIFRSLRSRPVQVGLKNARFSPKNTRKHLCKFFPYIGKNKSSTIITKLGLS